MKKFAVLAALVAVLATGSFAGSMAKKGSWTGWVSDAKCGAKVDADCAKKCIQAGEKVVFVNDADQSVLAVSNPDVLKGHEGHHVKVKGSVNSNTLTISEVSMMKDQSMK